jgi:hypothetical protein
MGRVGHNKLDESGAVVVRFNRKKGVVFGLLFAALFGSALGRLIDGSRSSTTGRATTVQKSGPCVRSGVAPVRGAPLVCMSSS